MSADPSDPASDDFAAYHHGPLERARIPRAQVEPTFLRSLEASGQLRKVPDGWDPATSDLPPSVTWILHPNGDLERLGFD